MTYEISDATLDQAAEIHALCVVCFSKHLGRINPPTSMNRETIDSYKQHILDDNCAVIRNAGKIIGCLFYKQSNQSFYIYKLAIAPEYQRLGLAKMLLAHVDGRALQSNATYISLNVRVELFENIALFTAHGYLETERLAHDGYTEPTYIVMKKNF